MAETKITSQELSPGMVVQMVSTNYSAVATGTTTIPYDDTPPQITEGTEFMTQIITPKSATNRVSIEATLQLANSAANDRIVALFQDATVNALAATDTYAAAVDLPVQVVLRHDMVAGTTSPTTFRIRAGARSAGTMTFNGQGGVRTFGGITGSNIKITEYKV